MSEVCIQNAIGVRWMGSMRGRFDECGPGCWRGLGRGGAGRQLSDISAVAWLAKCCLPPTYWERGTQGLPPPNPNRVRVHG